MVCILVVDEISASLCIGWMCSTLTAQNTLKSTALSTVQQPVSSICWLAHLKRYTWARQRQLKVRVGEHIQSIIKKDDERATLCIFLNSMEVSLLALPVKGIYRLNLPPQEGRLIKSYIRRRRCEFSIWIVCSPWDSMNAIYQHFWNPRYTFIVLCMTHNFLLYL